MHWFMVEKMQWKDLHCNGRHPSCTTFKIKWLRWQ